MIELNDDDRPAEHMMAQPAKKPAGAGWMNWFLLRRRTDRGDLVGSIALWSFLAILFCVLFGGSQFTTSTLVISIPKIDWQTVIGLLTPIIAHTVKGTAEAVRG